MRNFANTTYGCKIIFDKILSKDLESYAFKIVAFYESVARDQIMSIHISDDQTVHLGINISFKEETMFLDCSKPMTLSIAFRAYFIINYLHCLQTAKKAAPNSFFSGLVILESISDVYSNKRKIACVPNIVGSNKNLRPIDVHCAIRAVTRVLIENEALITGKAIELCEEYKDTLITYTGMPEVEYLKSKHAQYTVLCEMETLTSLVSQYPDITSECALLHQANINSFDSLSIGKLLSACDMNANMFWPGIVLRLLAITQNGKALNKYIEHSSLKTAYVDFCTNSAECYCRTKGQSLLLKDNWQAVQQFVREIEQSTDLDVIPISGMVHYIQ